MSHLARDPALHVVLHQPEIPQNTGNVGRTCVALGAKLWLVQPLGFRLDEYHLRRAGLDYWQHLQHEVVEDWERLETRLAESPSDLDSGPDRQWWLCTKSAERSYLDCSYRRGDVLVFGCETLGLPRGLVEAYGEQAIRIPQGDKVRSLNLATAVGIVAYEAMRQIGWS